MGAGVVDYGAGVGQDGGDEIFDCGFRAGVGDFQSCHVKAVRGHYPGIYFRISDIRIYGMKEMRLARNLACRFSKTGLLGTTANTFFWISVIKSLTL